MPVRLSASQRVRERGTLIDIVIWVGPAGNADKCPRRPPQDQDPHLPNPADLVEEPGILPGQKTGQGPVVVQIAVVLELEVFNILSQGIVNAIEGHVEDISLAVPDIAVNAGRKARIIASDIQPVFLDVDKSYQPAVIIIRVVAGTGETSGRVDPGSKSRRKITLFIRPARAGGALG